MVPSVPVKAGWAGGRWGWADGVVCRLCGKTRHGKEPATRKYLYDLFPYGYGQQACEIAGMRMPRKLMLDV